MGLNSTLDLYFQNRPTKMAHPEMLRAFCVFAETRGYVCYSANVTNDRLIF